jgi:hypothetical protein
VKGDGGAGSWGGLAEGGVGNGAKALVTERSTSSLDFVHKRDQVLHTHTEFCLSMCFNL